VRDRRDAGARQLIFVTLLVGYAGFYLCRANLDAAMPYLQRERGWDKEQLGRLSSAAILAYAIGKVLLGATTEIVGGRRIFLFALFGAVLASLGLGFATGFGAFVALACANRFVQSGGWGGLVNVVSKWFDPARHGAVMGGLSTSYEAGNVVALLISSAVAHRFGGHALFVVNPLLLAVIGVFAIFTLKDAPPSKKTMEGEGYRDAREVPEEKVSLREVMRRLGRQRSFWFALVMSFVLTFVRTGFLTWTPLFLAEVSRKQGLAGGDAAAIAKSAVFPAAGMFGTVIMGAWSDRLGRGKRAPVMAWSLVLLVASILVLAHGGIDRIAVALVALSACGLFLLGPYSLLAGAVALDCAEGAGAATAAGWMDGVGYAGASLAGIVIGTTSQRFGWAAAFDAVAAVTFVGLIVSIVWAREPTRA
jgi:sugar phosphate permease